VYSCLTNGPDCDHQPDSCITKITSSAVDNIGCTTATVSYSSTGGDGIAANPTDCSTLPFLNIKPVIASHVSCLMFNARSLCNKLVKLHYLLYSSKFDILLITESWLHAGIANGLLDPEKSSQFYASIVPSLVEEGSVLLLVTRWMKNTLI